jgi:hypothetical protein
MTERQLTDPQRSRKEAYEAESGRRAYTDARRGRAIVEAFRRYISSGDAENLTHALYDFLHLQCGFIAHFDLHGFRARYADPADLIEGRHEMLAAPHPPANEHVYADGMLSSEVYAAISALIADYGVQARRRRATRIHQNELAVVRALAEKHGLEVSGYATEDGQLEIAGGS